MGYGVVYTYWRVLNGSSAQTYQAEKRNVSRRIRDKFLRAGRFNPL